MGEPKMFRRYGVLAWAAVFVVTVTLGGCGSPTPTEEHKPAISTESKTQQQPTEHGERAGRAEQAGQENQSEGKSADASKGLAGLSDADRAAADKQRVCPVSGAVLGSMGTPYKVTVKDQTVFLCCPGCEKTIMKDPDKYLAKLVAGQTH
jgi:hypothetical protein